MRFDGHLILAEKGDALRAEQIALQLLQPERAPPDAQSPLTINHAMPGDVGRTRGERPPHHARRDVRPTQRRDLTV